MAAQRLEQQSREDCPNGDIARAARFFFLREFCFGSMFRTNAAGRFNVPYGGQSYNNKKFLDKALAATSEPAASLLQRTAVRLADFEFDRRASATAGTGLPVP